MTAVAMTRTEHIVGGTSGVRRRSLRGASGDTNACVLEAEVDASRGASESTSISLRIPSA